MIYETLGVIRGRATVSFGGESGEAIDVGPGDVVILLSGTGHQCLAPTDDLMVVGAYPSSAPTTFAATARPTHQGACLHSQAAAAQTDPVFGPQRPLIMLWRS